MTGKSFYITTPIYYPNDNLHIGHTYTTIAADVLKRFKTIQGYDTFFVTGTDEHGQKIQDSAIKAGKEPKAYVDEIVASIKDLWSKLEIDYDEFVRTTDEDHQKNAQDIFNKLKESGDIYKGTYEGYYCIPCESYWTESQLEDGMCPDCHREVEYKEEESYFFRLSDYQDRLLKYYEENPNFILPLERKNEMINNFFKDGLKDLSVTRKNLTWGVPVPGDEDHTIYVWIDALSCYLTGIGYGRDEEKFKNYWPANVHLMAKEIVRFHVIIWPALLMALGLDLPDQVFAHGWILFEDGKMSKSKGNVIYPEPIIERYGVDALKYFVLREFNFGADGSFSMEKLISRLNSDLANDLGNLVSRTTQMVSKYRDSVVPEPGEEMEVDKDLKSMAEGIRAKVEEDIENFSYNKALAHIWEFISRTNKYIDQTEPWVLAKDEEEAKRLDTVLYNLIDSIRIISQLIEPFIHHTAEEIQKQLGIKEDLKWEDASSFGLYKAGTKVERGDNLFPRLDVDKEVEALAKANKDLFEKRQAKRNKGAKEETNTITIDDFDKVELRTAKVLDCKNHPDADKLLVFQLDLGDEKRQVVSGIRKFYEPENLVGKTVVVVTNLAPVKLRGLESNGMILSAESKDGRLSLITSLEDVDPGAGVK